MIWADWWVYIILAGSVFAGCLLLNYIVNKINEVHLEERLTALQLKSPEGRVTQVPVPLLETGETTTRSPLPTMKNTDQTHEMKTLQRGKDNFLVSSDTLTEKIITKPIFLGSIYKSMELVERPTSNGNVGRSDKLSDEPDDFYYRDIYNELLDRMIAIVNSSKSQTDSLNKVECENRNEESKSSEGTTQSGDQFFL